MQKIIIKLISERDYETSIYKFQFLDDLEIDIVQIVEANPIL